ncbi:MAG: N-acetylglucosamine-6-phosphate deacetylase [Bacilli bacterium]|nr:N-acetylglucosamine-6-phosphate deacetylase [Bacilli bacterium]
MVIKNLKIVQLNKIIENGYISFSNGKIVEIGEGEPKENAVDGKGLIALPGFIDLHIHGSLGYDFMDATPEQIHEIGEVLYTEGVTTFLATTLTSDQESLKKAVANAYEAKKTTPNLLGTHLEGPYICVKFKGAQNEAFIRNPSVKELDELIEASHGNIRYISLAPENEGAVDFIKYAVTQNVVCSLGHSDATFDQAMNAIAAGATNFTHTHNAMSGYHHRKPGLLAAAMYAPNTYAEVICDTIHVCPNTIKTFYKIAGPDKFMIITDALQAKHSTVDTFQLFGLDCVRKNGAAYLTESEGGNLAGSLLNFDRGIRNVREITNCSLIDVMKISSYNQAKSLKLNDRGELVAGKLADFVLMDENLNLKQVYKLGEKVFEND